MYTRLKKAKKNKWLHALWISQIEAEMVKKKNG